MDMQTEATNAHPLFPHVEESTGNTRAAHAVEELCNNLARSASIGEAMRYIDAARCGAVGDGLLTVNKVTAPHALSGNFNLRRIWSSNQEAYPVGGSKVKTLTPWTRQVLVDGEMFTGEGDAVMSATFDDYPKLAALGLKAVVNVPILCDGECVATFNFMGVLPRWTPYQIAATRLLALLGTPWILRTTQTIEESGAGF